MLTGRNAPITGVESIEGPMITTVPVPVQVNRSASNFDYLQNIHSQTIARIEHEHFGLQHIRRLTPDARKACELKTGLVLQPNAELEDVEVSEGAPANDFMPAGDAEAAQEALEFKSYALMLVCSLGPAGVFVMASFDTNTISGPQMKSVLEQFKRALQQICQADKKVGDLRFLGSRIEMNCGS